MKRYFYLLVCLAAVLHVGCKKDEQSSDAVIKEVVFEATKEEISAGDSIQFKDLSVGYVTKWKWTFQGGTPESSTLSSPTVKYNTPGTYEVTVEVMNAFTQKTLTRKEYIKVDYNRVKADFKVQKEVYFDNETVTFTDASTGKPTTWQWEFTPLKGGATITSSLQNPVIKFTDTGYYNVSLTAANVQYSEKVTKNNVIRILDAKAISAAIASDQPATYAGGQVKLKDASVGNITTWQWTITGPETKTSTEQNPTITLSQPGRYKVTLLVTNPFNSSTRTIDNYITVVPGTDLAAFFPFNNGTADAGPNKLTTSTVGGGVTFASADRFGTTGATAAFNGTSGIFVANNTALNFGTGNYTVSCWVKTAVTTRMMVWQESGKGGTADNQTWLRIGDNATTQLARFDVEDGTGSTFVNVGTAGKMSDGAWHHVVCVRDGLKTTVYLDNVQVGTSNATVLKNVSNDQDFKIGFQEGATSNSNFFNGNIDDMVIYRKALTPAEIQALFNL